MLFSSKNSYQNFRITSWQFVCLLKSLIDLYSKDFGTASDEAAFAKAELFDNFQHSRLSSPRHFRRQFRCPQRRLRHIAECRHRAERKFRAENSALRSEVCRRPLLKLMPHFFSRLSRIFAQATGFLQWRFLIF